MSAYIGDGKYIFVSYSHSDKDIAFPFIEELQKHYNVWYDEGLTYGKEYDDEIMMKIENCSLFIFLLTENSIKSSYCLNEIRFATDRKQKPFINVILNEFAISDAFDFKYGRYQYCATYKFKTTEEAIEDIAKKSPDIETTKCTVISEDKSKNKDDKDVIKTGFDLLYDYQEDEVDKQNKQYCYEKLDTVKYIYSTFRVLVKPVDFKVALATSTLIYDVINTPSLRIQKKIGAQLDKSFEGNLISLDEDPSVLGRWNLVIKNRNKPNLSLKNAVKVLPKQEKAPYEIILGRNEIREFIHSDIRLLGNICLYGFVSLCTDYFIDNLLVNLSLRNKPETFKFANILYKPSYLKLPHSFFNFDDEDHLYEYFNGLVSEMNKRKDIIKKHGYSNIEEYEKDKTNKSKPLPRLIAVINGFDRILEKNPNIKPFVLDLLKNGKDVGIQLIITIRKPLNSLTSEDIKSCIQTKIAFRCRYENESIETLGQKGAELLTYDEELLISSPELNNSNVLHLLSLAPVGSELDDVISYINGEKVTKR